MNNNLMHIPLIMELFTDRNRRGGSWSSCGTRQKRRLTMQACFLPTTAHSYVLLYPPPAAQDNEALPVICFCKSQLPLGNHRIFPSEIPKM